MLHARTETVPLEWLAADVPLGRDARIEKWLLPQAQGNSQRSNTRTVVQMSNERSSSNTSSR